MRSVSGPLVMAVLLMAGQATPAAAAAVVPDLAPIEHRLVEQGVREQRLVLRDEAAWGRFWHRYEPVSAPPAFDFSTQALAVYLMGVQPSGGYSARVTGVRREGDVVVVQVLRCRPAPGSAQLTELTAPHAVAVVPRDLKLRWVFAERTDNGGACP